MDKELIDRAWRCLPREFREEVKKMFEEEKKHPEIHTTCGITTAYHNNMGQRLIDLFGIYNLTSDAEGEEEMLYVSRKKVQGLYDLVYEIYADGTKEWYQGYMKAMQDLFGSKCLSDEEQFAKSANCLEPKFKVGDKVRIVNDWHYGQKYRGKTSYITHVDESDPIETYKVDIYDKELGGELWYSPEDLEPCTSQDPIPPKSGELKPQTAETQTYPQFKVGDHVRIISEDKYGLDGYIAKVDKVYDGFFYTIEGIEDWLFLESNLAPYDQFRDPTKKVDDIIKQSFADHNRLHIAAMAMAGLLANEGVSCFTDVQELEHMDFITYHALEYADKLIKKSKEDGED